MSLRRRRLAATFSLCTLAVAGCADTESTQRPDAGTAATFASGSTMAELHAAGRIKIGVKFDQPGLGYKRPGSHQPTGFDIEIAKFIAGRLGIRPENIQWVETESQNRERFLRTGKVDLVLATYTINDARRKVVGQAGPYYVTGQQLLVRKDGGLSSEDDVQGKRVCSARGSTSIKAITEKYRATPVQLDTYSQCVERLRGNSVDAVSTDGAILLGYVAQHPQELKVIGEPTGEGGYGVGYRKGDTEMCEFINYSLQRAFRTGTWDNALFTTLWKTVGSLPDHPALEPCAGSSPTP